MKLFIEVYQKKIDYETGEEVLDENGAPIMEHVRDLIVPDPPPIPEITPSQDNFSNTGESTQNP